jgi:hypothetical protein
MLNGIRIYDGNPVQKGAVSAAKIVYSHHLSWMEIRFG